VPAFRECRLMNADPETPFGRHCLEQFDRLLETYSQTDAIFFDVCGCHYNLDFGYDDGVTMVHNKPAYCLKFAFQRIMERIEPGLRTLGKQFSANKPEALELPQPLRGNIFQVPDGRVIVTMVSDHRSMFEEGVEAREIRWALDRAGGEPCPGRRDPPGGGLRPFVQGGQTVGRLLPGRFPGRRRGRERARETRGGLTVLRHRPGSMFSLVGYGVRAG